MGAKRAATKATVSPEPFILEGISLCRAGGMESQQRGLTKGKGEGQEEHGWEAGFV